MKRAREIFKTVNSGNPQTQFEGEPSSEGLILLQKISNAQIREGYFRQLAWLDAEGFVPRRSKANDNGGGLQGHH